MGKINYFALIGVILFNLVLFLGIATALVAVWFSFWTIVVSFVLAPIILLGVNLMGIQKFDMIKTILSCLLFVIGIGLAPLAIKATQYLRFFFTKYMEYNKKVIYTK